MLRAMKSSDPIDARFQAMRLDGSRRHVFLCVGPDCCASESGLETWEILKAGLAQSGIPALRTKAACLRVCSGGPWMVIYPEGVWYGGVTPDRCRRIIQEHLNEGQPIEEWTVRRQPLAG